MKGSLKGNTWKLDAPLQNKCNIRVKMNELVGFITTPAIIARFCIEYYQGKGWKLSKSVEGQVHFGDDLIMVL